jgi:hypothetical protein
MPGDETPTESTRVTAEHGREDAEDLREEADRGRAGAEEHRALAESARKEAEQFRVLAEEARALRERYREELEAVRQEREALRHAAEEARQAAEGARHAAIAAVSATAEALRTNLAQMQFLEDARNTVRQLKTAKPGDVQYPTSKRSCAWPAEYQKEIAGQSGLASACIGLPCRGRRPVQGHPPAADRNLVAYGMVSSVVSAAKSSGHAS